MYTKKDLQSMAQLRRAIQLYAATLPEELSREVAMIYPAYAVGQAYKAGDYITDGTDANGDPLLYKVAQDHTSQEDWPPAGTPALYICVSLTSVGYPIWSQPTGAHDAYNSGDIVSHNGQLYKSKIDGNVWPPDTYPDGWDVYEEV